MMMMSSIQILIFLMMKLENLISNLKKLKNLPLSYKNQRKKIALQKLLNETELSSETKKKISSLTLSSLSSITLKLMSQGFQQLTPEYLVLTHKLSLSTLKSSLNCNITVNALNLSKSLLKSTRKRLLIFPSI